MPGWWYEKENGIAVLSRNRSAACNTVNMDLIVELDEMIGNIARDPQVRVMIVTAETMDDDISCGTEMNLLKYEQFFQMLNQVINRLEQYAKPKIFALGGRALNLVLEIALACDLRIATQSSSLGQPSMELNALPGGNGYLRLIRLIGSGQANSLAYTGEVINACQALEYGLVTRVVSDDGLLEETKKLAAQIVFSAGKNKTWQDQLFLNRFNLRYPDYFSATIPDQPGTRGQIPCPTDPKKIVFMESRKKPNIKKE